MNTISLAPLQGYTDFPLRNALHHIIGGVDKYYTPYLRLQNDGTLKKSSIKDILPENNEGIHVIPQILVNNAADFIYLSDMLSDYGYTEVNWNLGCPYPMVTKRKLGAGLLPYPQEINDILNQIIPKIKLDISIKLRAGYADYEDIQTILPILNNYPIKELILHPRYGKQLYKGDANIEIFKKSLEISKQKLAYNGDIKSIHDINNFCDIFNSTEHIMIGRGILQNIFLAAEYKKGEKFTSIEKQNLFQQFHDELFEYYSKSLSGNSHQINKMIHLWEYFSFHFEDQRKLYKRIKKSKTVDQIQSEIHNAINNLPFNYE